MCPLRANQRSVFLSPPLACGIPHLLSDSPGQKLHRLASPGTSTFPIGILLSLNEIVLGSIDVTVHLEHGTTLAEVETPLAGFSRYPDRPDWNIALPA